MADSPHHKSARPPTSLRRVEPHIEGVRGERFNKAMTNEDRRAFENVLLLCYPHHVATDDERIYTVEAMRKMKADHEARFAGVEARIMDAPLRDLTADTKCSYAQNGRKISRVLGWKLTEEELRGTAESIRQAVEVLATLPPATRSVLGVLLSRGAVAYDNEVEVLAFELHQCLGIDRGTFIGHVRTLEAHHFAHFAKNNDDVEVVRTSQNGFQSPLIWPMWIDLREFCAATGDDVQDVITNLRFDALDE